MSILPPQCSLLPFSLHAVMETTDILANIAFTTSGALVDCVDSGWLLTQKK